MAIKKYNLTELRDSRSNWKKVCEESLDQETKCIYRNRKMAVDMYIEDYSIEDISLKTFINKNQINRLIEKCITINSETGEFYGYAGLIPKKRLNSYNRTVLTNCSNGYSGAFKRLLEDYPHLQKFIYNQYFKRNHSTLENNITPKVLHRKFLEECKKLGIQDYEYPFNTNKKGLQAFYCYIKEMENKNAAVAIKRENKDSIQKFNSTGMGIKYSTTPLAPFSVVQIDGHKIDLLYTVDVENKNGEIVRLPAMRAWLILVIDVATRVVLGYSLTSNENYNQFDVLKAIQNAMIPRIQMNFTVGNFNYPEDGGYHTFEIPITQWAMFDTIMLDNAKSHLAENVIDKLTNKLKCAMNFGSVATPESRGIVERVFKTLEENGYHRLPSTTGSNIFDNKRNKPEKSAIKYAIRYDDILQMTEYFIAKYNTSSHQALDNQTPLECMKRRIVQAGMKPHKATLYEQDEIRRLTNLIIERTVRGGYASGKRPYITYEGVEYRNEILAYDLGLVGQKIKLEIANEDISKIRAYFSDGSEMGYLKAVGEWGRKKHSLKSRKDIKKYSNKNAEKTNPFYVPLHEYEEQLKERAASDRRARTKLNTLKTEQEISISTDKTKSNRQIESEIQKNIGNNNIVDFNTKLGNYSEEQMNEISGLTIEEAFRRGLL